MGVGFEGEWVVRLATGGDFVVGGRADHGGVVGGKARFWDIGAVGAEVGGDAVAESGVGGDTSGEKDGFGLEVCVGEGELANEDVDGGVFEAGGKISDLLRGEFGG